MRALALLFWWFAVISAEGEILVLSTHQSQGACETIHDSYVAMHLKTMKITKCLEKA